MAADLIVYFKSAIVRLLTLLASAIAVNIVALMTLVWMSRRPESDSVYGWDFVSFVRNSSSLGNLSAGLRSRILLGVPQTSSSLMVFQPSSQTNN
jgi:hypothetical protein